MSIFAFFFLSAIGVYILARGMSKGTQRGMVLGTLFLCLCLGVGALLGYTLK